MCNTYLFLISCSALWFDSSSNATAPLITNTEAAPIIDNPIDSPEKAFWPPQHCDKKLKETPPKRDVLATQRRASL